MVWGDDLSANKLKKTYVKGDLDVSAGNLIVQNSGNLMVMSQTEGLASITFSTTNINIFDGLNQYDMSYSTFGALNAIGVSFEESTGELLLRTKYISSSTISDIKKTLIGNVDTSCSLFVYGNTVCTMDSSINGVIRVGGGATIGGALDVVGDASLNQMLFVGGDSSLNGFLTVVRDASLNSGLRVGGDSSLNGLLTVTRDVSFGAGLRVGGDSSLNGFLTVAKDVSFGAGLRVGGDSSLNGFLTVARDVSLNAGLQVGGDSSLNGYLTVVRDVSFGAGLRVGGDASLNGFLTVVKDVSLNAGLRVGGDVSINGFLTVARDASLNAGLWINGDASLNSNLYVKNKIGIGKDASAGYALDVSGTSIARDTVYISSPNYGLDVSGYAVLRSQVAVAKDISAGYSLDVSGYTYLRNSVGIGRDASSSYALDVSGATVVRGPIAVAKDISTGYSLDVSGYTYLRNSVGIGCDASSSYALDVSGITVVREAIAIAKDISAGYSLDVSGMSLFRDTTYLIKDPSTGYALDVSGYTYLRNSVGIGCDASSSYALDISGATVVRGPIAVAKDISAAYALDVSGITAVRGPLVINKDISAGYMLDVSGITQFRGNVDVGGTFTVNGSSLIYEPVGSSASANAGSLVLMHGDNGGTSSVMFKSNTSTSDYAYMQYTENINRPSSLKYDLSSNVPSVLTGGATIASTGRLNYPMVAAPNDNSLNWIASQTIPNLATPVYCISFNQTNLIVDNSTSRINYLQTSGLPSFSSFSFSAWINPATIAPPSGSTPVRWMIANLTNATNNGVVDIWLENTGRILTLINDDLNNYMYSDASLVTGTWYHIVSTFDGTTKQGVTYINGVNSTINAGTGFANKTLNVNSNLIIGMKYGWNTGIGSSTAWGSNNSTLKGFRGRMAFVNIFDRSLSSNDVQYLYNNPSYVPVESGLLTIGIENDQTATNNDCIALMPASGTGFVGVNTRTPAAALDISGDILVNGVRAGRGGNSNATNTVFGNAALPYNTTGTYNVAIGINALPINTSGYQNVAIGYNTMAYITTGSQNTAIGHNCLSGAWDVSMNTAVGLYAGSGGNNGNKNTFLGYDTQINSNYSNCTVIGAGARGTSSNQVQLGSGCIAQAQSFNATSDYREKREIEDLDDSYTVDYLRPVSYKFIKNDDNLHIGFIAHEVQEHYPFLVQGVKDGPVPQSLNYNDLIGILTKELKDLKASVRELKETVFIQSNKLLLLNTTVLEQDALIQLLIKKD